MHDIVEYIDEICHCQSISELWEIHCSTMSIFGFDRLIYGCCHFLDEYGFGAKEDTIILYNHAPEYMKRVYGASEIYRYSPMYKWANENTGSCSWSWIEKNLTGLCPEAQRVIQINKSMGVTAGYTISFSETSARSRGIMSLTAKVGLTQSDVDEIWTEHGSKIEAMNHVANLKINSLPQQTNREKLTNRQREILELVGDGKTNNEIAQLLGLSVATIEKHLRIAREKLGATSTAQAILKISHFNQIHSIAS